MRLFRCVVQAAAPALALLAALSCSGPPPAGGSNPGAAPAEPSAATPAPPSAPAPDEGPPVDGDWLLTRLSNEPAHLNPLTSSDAYASMINALIFDSLLERDNVTLEHKARLADKWEISPDHLTYTFTLRPDAVFSDGMPVTAEDVKFTFDKVMDPATDAPQLRNYYKDIAACEVIDEHTVRYTCKIPYFRHLTMLGGLEVLPRHIYGTGDFNQHPNNRNPIGSGPYVLEKWETGMQIVLARNERFWKEKPHILKYVYKIITDHNAAFQVLDRQELDFMGLTPELWVNRAQKPEFERKFNLYKYYSAHYSYVGWNLRKPQFEDKRVRRALTLLLDRKLILETIYYGLGVEVTGEFFVKSPEYDASIEPWPFDPEQARALLDEAGWTDTDNDGVRDKDGVLFRFELLIRAASPEDEALATVYQEELKRAGIDMGIRTLEWAVFLERVDSRNYDAVRLAWSGPPIEGDPYQVWHSSQADKGSNFVGFRNAEADALMEQARVEFDSDKRIALYHRFHAILHDEQPYTFLFTTEDLEALDRRFRGVTVYRFGLDSREWWAPQELQRYR